MKNGIFITSALILSLISSSCSSSQEKEKNQTVSQSNTEIYNAMDTTQAFAAPGEDVETIQYSKRVNPPNSSSPPIEEYAEISEKFELDESVYQDITVVKSVQEELALRGYTPGKADGILGPQTLNALNKFQKQQGIFITDGKINEQTLDALDLELIPVEDLEYDEMYAE